jgi:hypothetical protein
MFLCFGLCLLCNLNFQGLSTSQLFLFNVHCIDNCFIIDDVFKVHASPPPPPTHTHTHTHTHTNTQTQTQGMWHNLRFCLPSWNVQCLKLIIGFNLNLVSKASLIWFFQFHMKLKRNFYLISIVFSNAKNRKHMHTNTQFVWCLYVANSTAFDFLGFMLCANFKHVLLKVVIVIEVLHNSVVLFCMKHETEQVANELEWESRHCNYRIKEYVEFEAVISIVRAIGHS